MTARLWSARASRTNAPRYVRYFRESLLAHLRDLPGYTGATLLERPDGEDVEILVITWWTSLDAIRGFAGADLARAVVSDEARALLVASDDEVRHYDVSLDEEA